jgi:adenosylcobinamide-GDP ribazoletransferase
MIDQFKLALMTLTRLPAGRISGGVPTVSQAAWAFPFVGLLIGGIGALPLLLGSGFGLSPNISAGLALFVTALATGALHEDGLADFADSFGTSNRVRKLEIMRDSRIGSYGVLALILVMGLRWIAIADLPVLAFIVVAVISRSGIPFALHFMPSARQDGLGAAAAGSVSRGHLGIVAGFALIMASCMGIAGLIAAGIAVMASLVICGIAIRKLGGQTGDVLGAMVIISETAALIALDGLL